MESVVSSLLSPGYTVQPASLDLSPRIHELIVAVEVAESGDAAGYALEEVVDDLKRIDPERDAWVVLAPDGTIAGYAYLRHRRHVRIDVEGYVHPAHQGQGIGVTLVRLSEGRAQEHVPLTPPNTRVVLHNWINAQVDAAVSLLEREGYKPFRYFFRMEADPREAGPTPEWPEGITVRAGIEGQDERAFYETVEEAMAEHWGHVPMDFEAWLEERSRGGLDLSLWFLALDGDVPAAATLCSVSEGVGWVNYLAVRPPWRRRGLGMALLRHAAAEFAARGLERMALGVDAANATGATRLYERAGMHIAQKHATYGKELRAGEELAD